MQTKEERRWFLSHSISCAGTFVPVNHFAATLERACIFQVSRRKTVHVLYDSFRIALWKFSVTRRQIADNCFPTVSTDAGFVAGSLVLNSERETSFSIPIFIHSFQSRLFDACPEIRFCDCVTLILRACCRAAWSEAPNKLNMEIQLFPTSLSISLPLPAVFLLSKGRAYRELATNFLWKLFPMRHGEA